MEFLTNETVEKLIEIDPYYKGRWSYYKAVIDILQKENFKKVLELGAY